MYGRSSFPLTNSIIFQDGYRTTKQKTRKSEIPMGTFRTCWRSDHAESSTWESWILMIRIANRGVLQLPTGDDGKSVSLLDGLKHQTQLAINPQSFWKPQATYEGNSSSPEKRKNKKKRNSWVVPAVTILPQKTHINMDLPCERLWKP